MTLALLSGLVAVVPNGAGARAEAPRLSLPIECTVGKSCWVVNYMDDVSGPDARDYHCGALTYDGHSGTDFAIRDLAEMVKGVPVRAAAPGIVKAVRDGMPDAGIRNAAPGAIKGRECGNGVLVTHPDGWETQYCHMRRGSITVRPGATVARGQRLGLVGLSGHTEFPHAHLTVRHNGTTVDPFLGDAPFGACRVSADALWDRETLAALAYRPSAIYNSGVAGAPPDPDRIRRGERAAPPAMDAPALVLWADIFGVDAGDRVALRLLGPDGQTIAENVRVIDKHQARRFEYAGRKARGEWPAGLYRGEITVSRADGAVLDHREERIELR